MLLRRERRAGDRRHPRGSPEDEGDVGGARPRHEEGGDASQPARTNPGRAAEDLDSHRDEPLRSGIPHHQVGLAKYLQLIVDISVCYKMNGLRYERFKIIII